MGRKVGDRVYYKSLFRVKPCQIIDVIKTQAIYWEPGGGAKVCHIYTYVVKFKRGKVKHVTENQIL